MSDGEGRVRHGRDYSEILRQARTLGPSELPFRDDIQLVAQVGDFASIGPQVTAPVAYYSIPFIPAGGAGVYNGFSIVPGANGCFILGADMRKGIARGIQISFAPDVAWEGVNLTVVNEQPALSWTMYQAPGDTDQATTDLLEQRRSRCQQIQIDTNVGDPFPGQSFNLISGGPNDPLTAYFWDYFPYLFPFYLPPAHRFALVNGSSDTEIAPQILIRDCL